MEVVVVIADRPGGLVGGSFDVIDAARLALANRPVSDLARNWHDEDEEDGAGR